MILKACKRPVKVDFPIAEVSWDVVRGGRSGMWIRRRRACGGRRAASGALTPSGVGWKCGKLRQPTVSAPPMRSQMLDHETLDDIIQRIVAVAEPEKIILYRVRRPG